MNNTDIKILELIPILKELGMVNNEKHFCESIGILQQNVTRVKQGLAHFTTSHVENICELYKVNANWIFGSSKNIFNQVKTSTKSMV